MDELLRDMKTTIRHLAHVLTTCQQTLAQMSAAVDRALSAHQAMRESRVQAERMERTIQQTEGQHD